MIIMINCDRYLQDVVSSHPFSAIQALPFSTQNVMVLTNNQFRTQIRFEERLKRLWDVGDTTP